VSVRPCLATCRRSSIYVCLPIIAICRNNFSVSGHGMDTVFGSLLPVCPFYNIVKLVLVLINHCHQAICKVWNRLCCMQCRCKCLNFTVNPLRLTSCSELKAWGATSSPPCANSPGRYCFPKFHKLLAILISAQLIGPRKKAMGTKHSGNMGQCCVASAVQQ